MLPNYVGRALSWVKNHCEPMSALGQKQTFAVQNSMSALPQKRTCAVQSACPLCANSGHRALHTPSVLA